MYLRTCQCTVIDPSVNVAHLCFYGLLAPLCSSQIAIFSCLHRVLTFELLPKVLICNQQCPLEGQCCLACTTCACQHVRHMKYCKPSCVPHHTHMQQPGAWLLHTVGCPAKPVLHLAWQAARVCGSDKPDS